MNILELIKESFESDVIIQIKGETVNGYVLTNGSITLFTDSSEQDVTKELRFEQDQEVVLLDGKLHTFGFNFSQVEVMVDLTIYTDNNGFFQTAFTL